MTVAEEELAASKPAAAASAFVAAFSWIFSQRFSQKVRLGLGVGARVWASRKWERNVTEKRKKKNLGEREREGGRGL